MINSKNLEWVSCKLFTEKITLYDYFLSYAKDSIHQIALSIKTFIIHTLLIQVVVKHPL